MKIFAIGDLHLPGGDAKPMDIFGVHWVNHFERICDDWHDRVGAQDVVLIPGDISWAMRLEDAARDLQVIGSLPGRKILLRGNHDYWWNAIGRVRSILPKDMYALQNDAVIINDQVFCGTRGWICPGDAPLAADDARIFAREVLRMEMSLRTARRIAPALPLTVMMHYPPAGERQPTSEFLELATAYGACRLLYGHLHGGGLRGAISGRRNDLFIHQVSCDGLGFRLLDVLQAEAQALYEC